MDKNTLLYVQTSQCHMHEEGQFDTAYHEHLSFFTSHSFARAADLAGLEVTAFQTTPIHGVSCLWTLRLPRARPSRLGARVAGATGSELALLPPSLAARLRDEVALGITSDFFYDKYAARAGETARWVSAQLRALQAAGYLTCGYGAAAKGMVLLHFLLARDPGLASGLEFVLDDAPLKQGTYCPGTSIPVKATGALETILRAPGARPLAVGAFAWNFWPELQGRLQALVARTGFTQPVVALLPFPTPRVVLLNGTTIATMPYRPTPLPASPVPNAAADARSEVRPLSAPRRKVMLISHFYNEEFLLPYWIRHHAHMFDHAVLIDFNSTDRSAEIIRREAPPTWRVVQSTADDFDSTATDKQVMHEEARFPEDWHVALTTTEFLVHPDLRGYLAGVVGGAALGRRRRGLLVRFRGADLTGPDGVPLKRLENLLSQRHEYTARGLPVSQGPPRCSFITEKLPPTVPHRLISRYAHAGFQAGKYHYTPGRHAFVPGQTYEWVPGGMIVKTMWTPWPEVRARKAQIGARVSSHDLLKSRGWHHTRWANFSLLEDDRECYLARTVRHNLTDLYGLLMRRTEDLPQPMARDMHRIFHDAGLS